MEQAVILRDVSFRRGNKVIFDHVNLTVPRGKIVAVMGPSGTGKTTLLRLLTGQIKPEQGEVIVNGESIPQLKRKELYRYRHSISMMFQEGALFTDLSVFDNVAFPLREHTKLPEDMIRDLVLMKLEAVGLRGAAKLQTAELSGGMARRVALARAIAMDPKLMMYDEPFTGQDPITLAVLLKLIKSLNDAFGMTSVMVTHSFNEAQQVADKIIVLSNGKIVGEGSPAEILKDETPAVYQFVHALPDGIVPFHYPARPYKEDLGLV